jgi:hypothetical protein
MTPLAAAATPLATARTADRAIVPPFYFLSSSTFVREHALRLDFG